MKFLIVPICSLLVFSCTHRKIYTYSNFSSPFVFVRQVGGDLEDNATGPLAVLWEDGKLLLPESPGSVGSSYLLMNVNAESVKSVEQYVTESGLWKSEEGGPVIADTRTIVVQINREGTTKSWLYSVPVPSDSSIARLTNLLSELTGENLEKIRWKEEYPGNWEQ